MRNLTTKGHFATLLLMDPHEKDPVRISQKAVNEFALAVENGNTGSLLIKVGELSRKDFDQIATMVSRSRIGTRIHIEEDMRLFNQMNEGNFSLLNDEVGALISHSGAAPRLLIQRSLALRNFDLLHQALKTMSHLKNAYISYWDILHGALEATPLHFSEYYEQEIKQADFVLKFQ